jgi:hypothetical protein
MTTDVLDRGLEGRLYQFRRELPGAVAKITEFVADNPGQVALIVAGTIVLATAARNVARPKTVVEVLALQAVLTAAAPLAVHAAIERGWLKFRVRDHHGCLVPAFDPERGD